jgi:hypothetical protein
MLSESDKITILEKYLSIKEDCYNDTMKDEIYFYFFEREKEFTFLEKLNTKNEIESEVEFLVSKMIIHEHEDGLDNIIQEYCP